MAADPEPGLELVLRRAESLVQAAAGFAVALEDIGAVELPPPAEGAVDQAQFRAIATLYLASELEAAGVIPAAERLIRLARGGSLRARIGAAAPLIETYWQSRNDRPTAEERLGFFSGLFGTLEGPDHAEHPRNEEFEDRLLDLCEALYKLDEQANNPNWGGAPQQARVREAAQRLAANLVHVSSGITVFVAQEILAAVRAALEILGHSAVKAAFHARSAREVVAAIESLGPEVPGDYNLYVRRGQAGMTLLAWLADATPFLDTVGKPIVGLDHPVIPAAIEWLETSLALSEGTDPAAPEPRPATPNRTDSPWVALAG